MCVIISIYNNSKNESKREVLADNLFHFNSWNGDGTAFFGFDTERESKQGYLRELKITGKEVFENLLDRYNISHFHFRNATKGVVDESNIHFWKFKNWIMAHNGQVYDYDTPQDIFSDSQLLFREMAKEMCFEKDVLDINKVNKIVSQKHFWGRLLFINTETKQSYYFGDFFLSVLAKDILVVSTTQLKKDDLILYGLQFQTQSRDIVEAKMEGIFKIDAKKQEFKKYKLPFNERVYDYGDYDSPLYSVNDYIGRSSKKWDDKQKKVGGKDKQLKFKAI